MRLTQFPRRKLHCSLSTKLTLFFNENNKVTRFKVTLLHELDKTSPLCDQNSLFKVFQTNSKL